MQEADLERQVLPGMVACTFKPSTEKTVASDSKFNPELAGKMSILV